MLDHADTVVGQMIGAGLSQRGHTSYVPNTSMLGYRGSVAVPHHQKIDCKRGDVGSVCVAREC